MAVGFITYMNPRRTRLDAATLEYQLVELQAAVEYHLKEPCVVDIVARGDVGRLAFEMLRGRRASDGAVERRAPIAACDGYRLTPRLTQRVEHVVDESCDTLTG